MATQFRVSENDRLNDPEERFSDRGRCCILTNCAVKADRTSGMRQLDHSVIIAVFAVWVMEVTVHQIVGMTVVRNWFVAAVRSVLVSAVMTATVVIRCAAIGICPGDFNAVLINMILMNEMQMTVTNRNMTAALLVLVRMAFVNNMILCHGSSIQPLMPACNLDLTEYSLN